MEKAGTILPAEPRRASAVARRRKVVWISLGGVSAVLLVAIVVTALTWTIYWFARHSRQRGWLS